MKLMIINHVIYFVDLRILFQGQNCSSSDIILSLTSIGEGTNSVICMTTRTDCCSNAPGETRNGEWYYPNGDIIPNSVANQDFYRNRRTQQVILNRRNNAMSPTGNFCCELINPTERICITLEASKQTMQSHSSFLLGSLKFLAPKF